MRRDKSLLGGMPDRPPSMFHDLAADIIDTLQLWSLGPNSNPPFVSLEKAMHAEPDPARDGRLDAVTECITSWLADHPALARPGDFTRRLAERVILELKAVDTRPAGMPAETIRQQCVANILQAEFQV